VQGSGSPWEDLNLTQLIELFPQATYKSPDGIVRPFSELRVSTSSVDREDYREFEFFTFIDTQK